MRSRMTKTITTTKEIKSRIKATHGASIKVLSEFVSWKEKMQFKCTACDTQWNAKPQNVVNGTSCPSCAWAKRRKNSSKPRVAFKEESHKTVFFNKIKELNITNMGNYPKKLYDNVFLKCNKCEHQWKICWHSFKYTVIGCPKCANKAKAVNILSNKDFIKWLTNYTHGRTILLNKYRGPKFTRKFMCVKCNSTWQTKNERNFLDVHCPKCFIGRQSRVSIRWLESMEKRFNITIQHAKNGGEFRIPGTRYRVDGFNKKLGLVFEFYGDAYHGNPDVYKPRTKCHPFNKTKTAKQLYEATMLREKRIKSLGYTVISAWEQDYRRQIKG